MSTLPSCNCGRPIPDNAHLCHRCTSHLARELGDIPALEHELDITRARLSRTGGQPIGGGHSSDTPLPWDERPVKAGRDLALVLAAWAGLIQHERGGPIPAATLAAHAIYLLGSLDWLRHREEAPDAKPAIEQAVGRLRHAVDRDTPLVFAGPCNSVDYDEHGQPVEGCEPCPAELYARQNAKTIKCPECQTEHDVKDRREWLLELAEDQLAIPAHLSQALSSWGMPVEDATIRKWVERGRLIAHGVDDRGRKMYRVGDVRELVTAEALRQQARTA